MFVFRFVGWLVGTGILFSSDTLCIYPIAYPREAKVPAMNVISKQYMASGALIFTQRSYVEIPYTEFLSKTVKKCEIHLRPSVMYDCH